MIEHPWVGYAIGCLVSGGLGFLLGAVAMLRLISWNTLPSEQNVSTEEAADDPNFQRAGSRWTGNDPPAALRDAEPRRETRIRPL